MDESLERMCRVHGGPYRISDYVESCSHYFDPPYYYNRGCHAHCLACWLCVGPKDFPDLHGK